MSFTYLANVSLFSCLILASCSSTYLSSANCLNFSSSIAFFLKPEPIVFSSSFVKPEFDCRSHLRYAIPLVTFLNLSGSSLYCSLKISSLIICECSAETPFTLCDAATHKFAIFTLESSTIVSLETIFSSLVCDKISAQYLRFIS